MKCQRPGCQNEIDQQPGGHRVRKFCSDACRVAAHRLRHQDEQEFTSAEQREPMTPAPTPSILFKERTRGYTLDIGLEGRMASGSDSGEGCLRTMTYNTDGARYWIIARYKEQEIGRGIYIKRGISGTVTAVETVEASGAMIGLIEAALQQRAAEAQARLIAERAKRLQPIACTCGQTLGYDSEDHCFAQINGESIEVCPACQTQLSLESIKQYHQERIQALQAEIQRAQEVLHLIRRLTAFKENSRRS